MLSVVFFVWVIKLSILNYCANLNAQTEVFPDVFTFAQQENIPIIDQDALNVVKHIVRLSKVKHILEIGTAIGYSGMHLLDVRDNIHLTTIEKDTNLFTIATNNFKHYNYEDRVRSIHADAKELDAHGLGMFDMLFIDASKANNGFFFDKYKSLLTEDGIVIVDNILVRGLVVAEDIESKNLNKMIVKVKQFNQHISDSDYHASFLPVGDGLMIISK